MENLESARRHVLENMSLPSASSRDQDERRLGTWLRTQKQNYARNTRIMSNPAMRAAWEAMIAEPATARLFLTHEDHWRATIRRVRLYIDENGRVPSAASRDQDELRLGTWLRIQKQNYARSTRNMSNPAMRAAWEAMIADQV